MVNPKMLMKCADLCSTMIYDRRGRRETVETITISTKNHETYSSVSNFFIDYYMTEANGEYVKVYLYLIRLLYSNRAVTIAEIADHFDSTEKDICRAIRYWIKQNVLKLEYTSDKVLTGITLLPLTPRAAKNEQESLLFMLGVEDENDTLEAAATAEETNAATKAAVGSSFRLNKTTAGKTAEIGIRETAGVFETVSAKEDNIDSESENTDESISTEASSVSKRSIGTAYDPDTADIRASVSVPRKVKYKPAHIAEKQEDEDFGNLLYQTETYFGKPLTQSDLQALLYIYEELEFSPELLEYLVEYCVSIGKKSCRYIEAVAIEWYKNQITTVEDAKVASKNYNSIYISVLKQLGIPNRVPTPAETQLIDTWYNTYSFNKNIIIEACRRAITANPHTANFNYVNGILENWHKQNVKTLSDIEKIDEKWAAEKKKKKTGGSASVNQFNQYESSTDDTVVDEFASLFLKETNG